MNGLMCCMFIQKLNIKLKKIYSFNKWLTQFNHYFFFIKRDSDNKFVNIWAMSTTGIWLWFFFSLQHRAWFCQTDCRGRPYLLLQTGRGKQLIYKSHMHFLFSYLLFFFSSEHEYIIVLEFFQESFYKQWKYLHKQMNLLQYYCCLWL